MASGEHFDEEFKEAMVGYFEINTPESQDVEAAVAEKTSGAQGLARIRSWFCCCKRRAAAAADSFSQSARTIVLAKPAATPLCLPETNEAAPADRGDDEGYSLLETPRRITGQAPPQRSPASQAANAVTVPEEDDFFDAQSEAGSDLDCPKRPPSAAAPAAPRGGHVARHALQERLATLLDIEQRCRYPDKGGSHGVPERSGDDLLVESIIKEDFAQLWFCHSKRCPFVIGCLCCTLTHVSVEDVVQAIQNPEQRLTWDKDSFSSFQLLRSHDEADPTREDVVFTVIPVPRPVRDREILQRRWQVPLGDGHDGGQALLMQSFEDNMLMPTDPQRVRAFTHLSGYILRPVPSKPGQAYGSGSLEVVVVSQCDLGGALPGWFQNLARRMARRRCITWAQKLQEHCRSLAQEREAAGLGA